MGVADGTVIGVTTVLDQGAESNQWNLVIMGDGYTSSDQSNFSGDVNSFLARFADAAPFSDAFIWSRINVYRLDVHSDESGADNPVVCADGSPALGGQSGTASTYFDATYCTGGLRRRLTVDTALAITTADAWVPDWDAILIIVNHVERGGSGAPDVAIVSSPGVFDGSAIHELGHSAFGLADEYDYLEGCASGETTQDEYPYGVSSSTPVDAIEPNVTIYPTALPAKWGLLIDAATPMPTTTNPGPTTCDTQPSPVADGVVGTFDGAAHYHSGIYRPAYDCRMRDADLEFCAVCSNVISTRIIGDSPCFVATAVYGDPFAPEVEALRRWRDRRLAPTAPGVYLMRAVSSFYGHVGPPLARYVAPRSRLGRLMRRAVFDPWAAHVARNERRVR